MKQLHKYITITFLKPLVATILVVLFIFTLWFLYRYIDELVGKGLSSDIILELLMYNAGASIPLGLPIAILFASLISFGNLAEFSELTAMKASGISLTQVLKPTFFVMIVVGFLAFYSANIIAPRCMLKMSALLYDLRQKKATFDIQPGIFYKDIAGYSIMVNKKDSGQDKLKDIIIHKQENFKEEEVIRAKSGTITPSPDYSKLYIRLYNGTNYRQTYSATTDKNTENALSITNFKTSEQVITLKGFKLSRTPINLFSSNYQSFKISELLEKQRLQEKYYKDFIKVNFRAIFPDKSIFKPIKDKNGAHSTKTLLQKRQASPGVIKAVQDKIENADYNFKELATSFRFLKPVKYTSQIVDHAFNFQASNKNDMKFILQGAKNVVNSSLSDLDYLKHRIKIANMEINNYQIEFHRKIALAAACLVLFFIGAPLAFVIHKGGIGLPLVISVFFFLLFYALNITGEKIAKAGVVPPIIGLWSPVGVLLLISVTLVYLCLKEVRPSLALRSMYLSIKKYINIKINKTNRPI